MALKNENGNYLRISGLMVDVVNPKNLIVRMDLWASEAIRLNPSKFDNAQVLHEKIDSTILTEEGLSNTSIKNSIISKAYLYLKANGYSDWEDC